MLEILGAVFISGGSGFLHFLFEWSGYAMPAALIAAVNESLWEHLKIAFWPAVLWAGIERLWLGERYPGFVCAKAISFLVVPTVTLALYLLYTTLTGAHNVLVDILGLQVAIALGQATSYRWMVSGRRSPRQRRFGVTTVAVLTLLFSTMSFFAPQTPLHVDNNFGSYGILSDEEYAELREISQAFMRGEY